MFVYVLNCFFAAVNVFTEGQTLEKLFLFGAAWTVQTAVVAAYLPYEDWSVTVQATRSLQARSPSISLYVLYLSFRARALLLSQVHQRAEGSAGVRHHGLHRLLARQPVRRHAEQLLLRSRRHLCCRMHLPRLQREARMAGAGVQD
jgi:hypothetical protein